MARPSPQTQRIRQIIDLLVSHPRDSFHLAEIARHLGISKAGCYPMVTALTEAGWLIRHPTRKTYRLGPALITIGKAAESVSPTDYALPALRDLARETGCPCIAVVPSGHDVVLAEIVNPSGQSNEWMGLKRGHRMKIVAPLGSALFLHATDEEIDDWLMKSSLKNHDEARKSFLPALRASRERGYVVELRLPTHEIYVLTQRLIAENRTDMADLLRSMSRVAAEQLRDREYLVAEIDDDKMYTIISIDSPVYGPSEEVEMILSVTDFPTAISGRKVKQLGELIREVAARTTEQIIGVRNTHVRAS
jgi:DNA-binding IclR family transcriptional regulator